MYTKVAYLFVIVFTKWIYKGDNNMSMENNFIPPPMLKKDKNGNWHPVYNPTQNDWNILVEERAREHRVEDRQKARRWCNAFVEVIKDFFK